LGKVVLAQDQPNQQTHRPEQQPDQQGHQNARLATALGIAIDPDQSRDPHGEDWQQQDKEE
jgi:hypothetical protein